MSDHEPLDYGIEEDGLNDEQTETDPAMIPAYTGVVALIVGYLALDSLMAGVVVAVVAVVAAGGLLLYLPGEFELEVDGVSIGTPGEWGFVDEEVSE